MQKAIYSLILVSLTFRSLAAQQKNGKASAIGSCSVAHSGNNDTINIKNCGISLEQGNKIIKLLQQVLKSEPKKDRDAKLDELLRIASQPLVLNGPVIQQGGDCTQNVVGGSNNTNNCAPKAVAITSEQATIVREFLKSVAARGKVSIGFEYSAPDGATVANALGRALQDSGLEVDVHGAMTMYQCNGEAYAGLSMCFAQTAYPLASNVGRALSLAKIVTVPINATQIPDATSGAGGKPYLRLMIRKP